MLNTLLKIGQWQSDKTNEWDRFINKPKVSRFNKKNEPLKNYIIGLVFDLDEGLINIDTTTLREFDEANDPAKFNLLKIQGGNNKAIYTSVEPTKFIQLYKTFFGKLNKNNYPEKGELQEIIEREFSLPSNERFRELLKLIFSQKRQFKKFFLKEDDPKKLDPKKITKELDLSRNENLVFIYACVKCNELGYPEPTPVAHIAEYTDFIFSKFIDDNKISPKEQTEKLCYASGEKLLDVEELNLKTRRSLNKMFVTETRNYANLFNEKAFQKNYQLSKNNQILLDLASTFVLNNYKTRIAGLNHVIIPQFLQTDNIDFDVILGKLKTGVELLFSFTALEDLSENIEIKTDNVYWLNFLAFESDGNFFKSTNLIKDVSKFHFLQVIRSFHEVQWEMREMNGVVDWDSVMNDYGKIGYLNFNTVYGIIPLRKDKEKKNTALHLFKSVLENRKIEIGHLFEYFCELILCYRYERYKSYTNIKRYGGDYFIFAVRDAVFKYLAFFQVIKKLKLLNMEQENIAILAEEVVQDFVQRIQDFFEKMKFNDHQKAMFYLGRILSSVAYMQLGKNKTVIEKVNYHGMDRDDIVRLRKDLFEKAKQYNQTGKIIFNDSKFGFYFNFNEWNMNPQEAVFFLLTGYSFGIVKQ